MGGWSTLSGGRKPYITMAPYNFVEKLIRAASCVPLVRTVRVFVVNAQGQKRRVSPEELAGMDIKVQTVPNMYKQSAASSPAGSSSASPTPSVNLDPIINRQNDLENQLNVMKTMLEMIADRTQAMAAASDVPKDGKK